MVRVKRVKARKAYECGRCGKEISPGDEYYSYSKRTSYKPPRGVRVKRCLEHYPRLSETTGNPRRAQVYAISEGLGDDLARLQREEELDPEEFSSRIEEVRDEVETLAEEIREGAENIEMGFGWATEQSEEMVEKADAIDEIVSELEQIEWPDAPERPELADSAEDVEKPTEEELRLYREELEGYRTDMGEWKDAASEALREAIDCVDRIEV